MRANICIYFKNADLLMSSAQNINILSGSPRSVAQYHSTAYRIKFSLMNPPLWLFNIASFNPNPKMLFWRKGEEDFSLTLT